MRGPLALSWKKAGALSIRSDTAELSQLRHSYAVSALALDFLGCDLVYIDECSVNTGILRKYCWGKIAKPSTVFHQDKEPSLTVIAAVSKLGLIHMVVNKKTTNSAVFIDFCSSLK